MKTFCVLLLSIVCSHAWAWEVDTHAWITLRAFERSQLKAGTPEGDALLRRLGFHRYDPQVVFQSPGLTAVPEFGQRSNYFDLEGDWGQSTPNPAIPEQSNRVPNDWEHARFPEGYRLGATPGGLGPQPQLRLEAWLMRGVVREDDLKRVEYIAQPVPERDPYGDITRVFGHFYDPINDHGILLLGQGEQRNKAINWALGLEDALAPSFNPLLSRRNHFTWLDARRALYKALTYQSANVIPSSFADEYESEVRLFFLATTLKALGQVVHVLQDGSQPQHSRLDRHNHSNVFWAPLVNADLPRRLMEVYTNVRITRDLNLAPLDDHEPLREMFTDHNGNLELPPLPPVGTYPIPQFSTPRRFMTTRTQAGSDVVSERKGLMDYSSRGFFTVGTANGKPNLRGSVLTSPPSNLVGFSIVVVNEGDKIFHDATWPAADAVAPTYIDALDPIYLGQVPQGKLNLVSGRPGRPVKLKLEPRHLRNHANVLLPRAVAYSAGMINYFFRGTLEIEPIEQKVFAVANQGEPHSLDAAGWPRKTSNNALFGFEKLRLKVRNISVPITEPGAGGVLIPQTVAAGGELILVARYHRNLCYRPDLSGERTQTFPVPPLIVGPISEPACGAVPVRSRFQDISVSAPVAINSVSDLPGGAGDPLPASVEKTFDLSADPIPINATDLILQVVYRGTLGEEPESIALGSLDVREPTIMTFWENTDYFLDTTNPPWRPFNASFPRRPIQYFRFCVGPSSAERVGYWFAPPLTGNAMMSQGATRIAVIVPAPTTPTDRFRVKGTPVTSSGPSGIMQPLVRTAFGRVVQANREFASTAAIAAPFSDCATSTPSAAEFWCNEPLQRRRNLILGSVLQPVTWVSSSATGFNTPDVGTIMPAVPGSAVQPFGEVRFNDSGALVNCPPTPTSIEKSDADIRYRELEEVARSLGIKL